MHDELAIRQCIARFANSFDLKDWQALGECLTDQVYTDYSELRGTPPETLSRDNYVLLRQSALQHLNTHHLAGNAEVVVRNSEADARVSMAIFRRNQQGETLHTHCLYLMQLQNQEGKWRISSIVQKVFWSDGQTAIHSGIQKT